MLVMARDRGVIRLADTQTEETKWSVQAHHIPQMPDIRQTFMAVAADRRGSAVVSIGGDDTSWKMWDTTTGNLSMTGAAHDFTGICDCTDQIVSSMCPKLAHVGSLSAVVFSQLGYRFATGDRFGVVITWDATTGEALLMMSNESNTAVCSMLSFSSDGEKMASGSVDRRVFVWDTTTGGLLRTFGPSNWPMTSLHFLPPPANPDLLVVHKTYTYSVWNTESGGVMDTRDAYDFLVISPDGRTYATHPRAHLLIPNRAVVRLINPDTGVDRARLELHGSRVFGKVAFSPDSSKIATLICTPGLMHSCRVWSSSTGTLTKIIHLAGPQNNYSMLWSRSFPRETQRAMAFAMGNNPRLGIGSRVLALDPGVVQMIISMGNNDFSWSH
jgi:WD40 repeat protein